MPHLKHGLGDAPVSNFFRAIYLQADQEQRVELINNYLQLLWRAGLKSGLTTRDPVMQKLDATMNRWWMWKQQYDEAVMRRWVPFTRSWGSELNDWSEQVTQLQNELSVASSGKVDAILAQQGLSPKAIAPDASTEALDAAIKALGTLLKSQWLIPVIGLTAALFLVGTGLKLVREARSTFG